MSLWEGNEGDDCVGPYGWLYEDGKFRGLCVGTKVVITKSGYTGYVGQIVELHSDGRVSFLFPNFSTKTEIYKAAACKKDLGIAVIPPDTPLKTRMPKHEATKYYMPHKKIVVKKSEDEPAEKVVASSKNPEREGALLHFLALSVLSDIIFEYENAIQLWFSPLGWVFENGVYLGLEKGTKVVCTKSRYMGYVGWVEHIHSNSPKGIITYYFPMYSDGRSPERYSAAKAIRTWGLCVVPEDTELQRIMTEEESHCYLRVPES